MKKEIFYNLIQFFSNFFFFVKFLILFILFAIFFIFIFVFNIYAQQNNFFDYYHFYSSSKLFFINDFKLNPSLYAFDDNIYSFSYVNYFNQYSCFSSNILNIVIFGNFYNYYTNKNDLFIGIPIFYKTKNYPLSLGLMVSNLFINVGYFVRFFNFLENGMTIFYIFDENIFGENIDNRVGYEIFFGLKVFKNIKIKTNFYFDNSSFYQSIDLNQFFNQYFNYNLVLTLDFENLSFIFTYFPDKVYAFNFSIFRKYSKLSLTFSIDLNNSSYSIGFGFSNAKTYRNINESGVLYIIDFNFIKPDANLFLQLREKAKKKGNIFLFISGKNLNKITEIEDLEAIIKELKKNNLCFTYINQLDLFNLAFASSSNYIILNKNYSIDLSYNKVQDLILNEIIRSIYEYLKNYKIEIDQNIDIEKIVSNISLLLLSDEKFKIFVNKEVQYLVDIILENRKIDKDLLLDFAFNNIYKIEKSKLNENSIYDLNSLNKLNFFDFVLSNNETIFKIKEIALNEGYNIKAKEFILAQYSQIYKDKTNFYKNIAIVYLKGLIICDEENKISKQDEKELSETSILNLSKVEKIIKKIEDGKFIAALFIIDSSYGQIEEGEKINNLIKNLGKKIPVYILYNSFISTGALIGGLQNKNLFIHKSCLIIPALTLFFDSIFDQNDLLFFEKILSGTYIKIESLIDRLRNLTKKDSKTINEIRYLNGYDAVGLNLSDFVVDFNSLINILLKQINIDDKDINFEILDSNNF